ncbi:hypothetical protein VTK73DRAFT_3445 [Phialemonium thermophilum]|uniref:Uncharacterized protein n=1 Tax=Phialemonium thermophilum TaxID=223376 RepID=A0ABR3WZC4_9PEZI
MVLRFKKAGSESATAIAALTEKVTAAIDWGALLRLWEGNSDMDSREEGSSRNKKKKSGVPRNQGHRCGQEGVLPPGTQTGGTWEDDAHQESMPPDARGIVSPAASSFHTSDEEAGEDEQWEQVKPRDYLTASELRAARKRRKGQQADGCNVPSEEKNMADILLESSVSELLSPKPCQDSMEHDGVGRRSVAGDGSTAQGDRRLDEEKGKGTSSKDDPTRQLEQPQER